MSWESYQRRASGTNVQRILSEMAESQRLNEAQRAKEEQLRQQREYEQAQSNREIQARIMGEYMQHPNQQSYDAMVASGLVPKEALPVYSKNMQDLAEQSGIEAWNADPINHGLGAGGPANAFYNRATGGHNPNENLSASNISTGVYQQQATLPKERVEAQRVDDKLDLSAWEGSQKARADRKFLEIERPESKAKIEKSDAETVLAGARTKKLGEPSAKKAADTPPNKLRKAQIAGIEKRLTKNYNDAKESEVAVATLDPEKQKDAVALAKKRHAALNEQIKADVAKRDAILKGRAATPTVPVAPPPPAAKPSLRRESAPATPARSLEPTAQAQPQINSASVARGIANVRASVPALANASDEEIMRVIQEQANGARQ